MIKKTFILLISLSIILAFGTAVNAVELASVNYYISGDSMEISTLELEPVFRLDGGHRGKVNLAFDGTDFNIAGDFGVNLLVDNNFRMDLHLMLTNKVQDQSVGKAIGISAETLNADWNFFWRTYYFIDNDLEDHTYYRGGAAYSIGPRTDLEISVGNQYWDLNNRVFNLGIRFEM